MKIHVTENIDQALEGYIIIPILYGKVDVGAIPNNAATSIIAIDAMDSVPTKFFDEFIKNIIQKMRINGELILGGTDLAIISRDVVNRKISCDDYNELIFSKRGIYNSDHLIDVLRSAGLSIETVILNGYNYEIKVKRKQNNN